MKKNIFNINNRKEVNKMRKIGLMALMAVMLIGMVYGTTCSFVQTATVVGTADGYIEGGSHILNVTIAAQANAGQNVTAVVLSASPGTISGKLTYNTSNSENMTKGNFSVDTFALADITTQTFTATMYNRSGDNLGTCTLALISNNTVPTCVFDAALKSSNEYPQTQEWVVTGVNASVANIQFGSNAVSTMSRASTLFSYTGTKTTLPEGTYTVKVTTGDGLDSTVCSLSYVDIDSSSTLKQVAVAIATMDDGKKTSTGNNNSGMMLVLIAGAIGIYYFKKK